MLVWLFMWEFNMLLLTQVYEQLGHLKGLAPKWLRKWYSKWCLYSVTKGHLGQVSIFSGLMWILVCLQKSSFVTATNSHCLHLKTLTLPCELILGTRIPWSSSKSSGVKLCSSFKCVLYSCSDFVSNSHFGHLKKGSLNYTSPKKKCS